MMLIYAILSTLIFGMLGFMLRSGSWQGTMLKFICYAMMVFGIIVSLSAGGLIVQAPAGMRWF